MNQTPALDLDQARHWLTTTYGDAPGLINICSTGSWVGRNFTTDHDGINAALTYIHHLDQQNKAGIYARVTTLRHEPPPRIVNDQPVPSRGDAALSLAFPGFWADIDIAGPGHKTKQTLPPDTAAARAIITASGLPEPTLWIHSGGGLYPWHILDTPLLVDDTNRTAITALSEKWQRIIGAAATRLGYHYGTGVGDLARVLRIPGTVNRKTNEPRPCRVLDATGVTYNLNDLADLAAAIELPAPAAPEPKQVPPRRAVSLSGFGTIGPFDALAEIAEWRDLLEPLGWTYAGSERDGAELWRRPGGTSPYSARCGYNGVPVAVIHSEDAGLPSGAGHKLTMGRLFAHLHHGGREDAAASDLRAAAAGSPTAGPAARALRATVLDHIRHRCNIPAWTERTTPPTPRPEPAPTPAARAPQPEAAPLPPPPPDPDEPDSFTHTPPPAGPDVRAILTHDDTPEADIISGLFTTRAHLDALPWTAPGAEIRDRPPLPFPTHALPGDVGKFAHAVATYTQVPVDIVAFAVLGALALVVGGHATINGQWREHSLNLFLVSILESGEGKSPAFDAVTPPVRALETQLRRAWQDQYGDDAEAYEIAQKTRDRIITRLAEADGAKRTALKAELEAINLEIADLKPPPYPQLFAGDILPEALGRLMHRVGGHMGIMSAEGGFLGNICGRYNNGKPNLELVLVAYDTSEPYRPERISRESFEVDRPSLTVSLSVQPVVVEDAASSKAVLDRGLLNRFLFAKPQSLAGQRDSKPPRVPMHLVEEWDRRLRGAFYAVLPDGQKFDEQGEIKPPAAMQVSDAAEELHLAWRAALERRLDPDAGDLAAIKGWARKLTGTAYRLAAILHLAAGLPPHQPVDSATMRDALTIADYCIPHAQVVLMEAGAEADSTAQLAEPAQHVLGWIRRKRPVDGFTVDSVRTGLRGRRWVKELGAAGVRSVLVYLARRGWVASVARSDEAGRRLADGVFLAHPDLLNGAL